MNRIEIKPGIYWLALLTGMPESFTATRLIREPPTMHT